MKLSWDEAKRQKTLADRGLDFADAKQIFDNEHLDALDTRFNYGETRILTLGFIRSRLCALVWTPRAETRRVISLRKANEDERKDFEDRMGRPR